MTKPYPMELRQSTLKFVNAGQSRNAFAKRCSELHCSLSMPYSLTSKANWMHRRANARKRNHFTSACALAVAAFLTFVLQTGPASSETTTPAAVLDERFTQALNESDPGKALNLLDEILAMADHEGENYGPALYLKALRNASSSDGRAIELVLQAVDAGMINAAFLLPDIAVYGNLPAKQKAEYMNKSFGFLEQRTSGGAWIVPLVMYGIMEQQFGKLRSPAPMFAWYAETALEGASPIANSFLLENDKNSDESLSQFCGRIELSGTAYGNQSCKRAAEKGTKFVAPDTKLVQRYQEHVRTSYGASFEAAKALVCGELDASFAHTNVCYDALAAASEICIIRSQAKSYAAIEGRFVCNRSDIQWVNRIMAKLLSSSLRWNVAK